MESKNGSSLVKDALVLTIITLVAGVLLGLVYEVTKAPIAAANEAATQAAYREVFSDADSFIQTDADVAAASDFVHENGYEDVDIDNILMAVDKDKVTLGYVLTVTSHEGYGGDITFSMGITNEGILNGYSITDISETAGLGMKAKEEKFMSNFAGIPLGTYTVTKTSPAGEFEIEAISGATITSRAMTNAVDAGMAYYSEHMAVGTDGGELPDSEAADTSTTDEASTEESSTDEASTDEASTDEASIEEGGAEDE